MSPAITERTSLLTQGLEPLAKHSAKARDLLDRLYALDDDLQDAHVRAKRDDEYGEDVVQAYRKFLALRQILIDELERLSVPVPWQMRMRIDDIELTLRQREEKSEQQSGKKKKKATANTTTTTRVKTSGAAQSSSNSTSGGVSEIGDVMPLASSRERRIVTLLVPSLVVLVLALLWYQWFS